MKDINISTVKICLYILHVVPPHYLQQTFLFSRSATLGLTGMSFKSLSLLNLTLGTLSKLFPCSMSGNNKTCISDSTLLSSENTG